MQSHDREREFDELYARHRRSLHAYFLGRTGDRELALDLLQELFLRVWRSLQSVHALPPQRRQYWLYAVARNLVVDTYRTRGAAEAAQERIERLSLGRHAASPESAAVDHEQLQVIDVAIRRLPDDLRVVLVLHVLGEQTSREIGEILGRPAGTVRYQLAEARRRLAGQLQGVTDV